MAHYLVTYDIEVDADSPLEAALEVEKVLNEMEYRPYLNVKNMGTGEEVGIDLDYDD